MKFFVLMLSLIIFSLPDIGHADSVPFTPRLKVSGNTLAAPDGTPVSLRGLSLCSLEWHDPLSLIAQATHPRDGWRPNVLRLPVQTREWARVGAKNYLRDYLDPAVKACEAAGVYCIIDWHAIDRWDDPDVIKDLREFWRVVAPRYAAKPFILYEFFNEPTEPKARTPENWNAWRSAAQPLVAEIRALAPDTVILVGNPHWDQMPSFALDAPFSDDNLMYVVHVYPQFKPGSWDALFGAASEKLPIFMTEFGWTSQEKNKEVITYGTAEVFAKPLRAYLDARPHISWTAWSFDPKCGPAMLGEDAGDMGTFVKKWLQDLSR